MPAEVILIFDLAGVLTTSPYPAARRLAEAVMRCVFERAGAHILQDAGSDSLPFLAQSYSHFFSVVRSFTNMVRGMRSTFERLELGEIHRMDFITLFRAEIDFMLTALAKKNPEELASMNITNLKRIAAIQERYPLLAHPVVQELLRELVDPEAYLCTMEKVSPRMNVLNLLHYLRMKSQQEIRLVVVANTWEVEGQYQQMLRALSTTVGTENWTYFPTKCPLLYGDSSVKGSFSINGLFDAFVQSYLYHKRKPFPDIIQKGVDEAMSVRVASQASLQYNVPPHLFMFDDVRENCEVARKLPDNPFDKIYYIENGAYDVYEDVLDALRRVGEKDAFWADVAKGVETEIGPLFHPPRDEKGQPTSWINEEMNDYNKNLLYVPPPLCESCDMLTPHMYNPFLDDEDKDAILYYCAKHLPHLFPIEVPQLYTKKMDLLHKPGFATSAGPIAFERMQGLGFLKTYRITLRTGSFTLRVQPPGPTPYGIIDVRTEFEVMQYLSKTSSLPMAKCLLYCDSHAVCGRRFSLRRFIDGEVISTIGKLIQPRVQRPYSRRRQIVNVELDPRRFFKEAVKALSTLHNVPIPPFFLRNGPRRGPRAADHPLLTSIREWMVEYKSNLHIGKKKPDGVSIFCSQTLEELSRALVKCFDTTRVAEQSVPQPGQLVLLHGDFKMRDLVFSYRSLEGRQKYPPTLLGVMNFNASVVGDPLMDVASLALFSLLPIPNGTFGAPADLRALFPSPADILDNYCCSRGYMQELGQKKRESIFAVYLAATCLRQAVTISSRLAKIFKRKDELPMAEARKLSLVEHLSQQGLAVLGRSNSKL